MDFLTLVQQRKSVRTYADKPVPRDVIKRCIETARLAPSACNSQPWSFIVVDDPALKSELADRAFSGIYSMNTFARSAPVLIVVITERSVYTARLGGLFRKVRYNLIDVGIACEHLVLKATEEGLGSCWLGWFDEKAVKKILGIPRFKKVDIILCLGYPETEEKKEKKRKSFEEMVTYNSQLRNRPN